MTAKKTCFVTVGTTEFDALVRAVDTPQCLLRLQQMGFTNVTIQYGRGHYIPITGMRSANGIQVTSFDFKPTLRDDMKAADLIISHAGAGSVMESLRLYKPLVVVVNDELMDNHQIELAEALGRDGYLFYCETPRDLVSLLEEHEIICKRYPERDEKLFSKFMDEVTPPPQQQCYVS